MESSEKTRAYISWDTNLHQQADFWQGGFFHSCRNSEHASQSRHVSLLCALKFCSALLCSGG